MGAQKTKGRTMAAMGTLTLAALFAAGGGVGMAQAQEAQVLDEVSVTATRAARSTKAVPEAITVVGKERMEQARMFNVKDAIAGTPGVLIDSKNGGYDARLVIRGAGQKANYGVREIMVIRDGVPMTDPDSFTRLDFIDPQDMERIEVTKGPGSLYGGGAAGGVIQIISRSVFDTENRLSVGMGAAGTRSAHLRVGGMVNDHNALAFTFSHRAMANKWRRWNEFSTHQVGVKYGRMLGGGAVLEGELSYAEANMQLPGSMNQAQFDDYRANGEQKDTADAWKHSARDSKIWFFNTRLEKTIGDFTLKPRIYFTHWSHFHPVTGVINVSPNNQVYGVELELNHAHQLLGQSELVAGVTARQDRSRNARKYQYRDVTTIPFGPQAGRITSTLSNEPGTLMETEDATNTLYGVYLMETLRPWERVTVDMGVRLDRSIFDIETQEDFAYSYATGKYVAGAGASHTDKAFTLWSPKVGVVYTLTPQFNIYASVAQSDQVPSTSELQGNTALEASTARNYEVGIKGRGDGWRADATLYSTRVTDEIVSVLENGQTVFQNAGATDKRGLELSASHRLPWGFTAGVDYAYSDYTFDSFSEVVGGVAVDRSGNRMPFVPRQQYGFTLDYDHESGFQARVRATSRGGYAMDNANSEQYEGYDFLTTAVLSYRHGAHLVSLNVENLFDDRYAVEAKKDTRGTQSYSAGAPRSVLLTWKVGF